MRMTPFRKPGSASAVTTRAVKGGARSARSALVNGAVGVVVARLCRLMMVLDSTISNEKIDAIADPERLRQLDLAVLND
jgi:RNA polymerase sigma-70 factor (ECF subfamily)